VIEVVWNILECGICAKLNFMTYLIQRKCDKFVDQLIGDGRLTNSMFISSWNVLCNL